MNRKHFDYIFGNICRVQKQLAIPWLPTGAFEKVLYSAELWARDYNGITLSQIIGVHPVMHMTGVTASYVSYLLFDPHWEPVPALLMYLKLSDRCAKYFTLLGLALGSAKRPSCFSLSSCLQRCICSLLQPRLSRKDAGEYALVIAHFELTLLSEMPEIKLLDSKPWDACC